MRIMNFHFLDRSRIPADLNAFLADNYEQGHEVGSSLVYDSRAWVRSRRKPKEKERRPVQWCCTVTIPINSTDFEMLSDHDRLFVNDVDPSDSNA